MPNTVTFMLALTDRVAVCLGEMGEGLGRWEVCRARLIKRTAAIAGNMALDIAVESACDGHARRAKMLKYPGSGFKEDDTSPPHESVLKMRGTRYLYGQVQRKCEVGTLDQIVLDARVIYLDELFFTCVLTT